MCGLLKHIYGAGNVGAVVQGTVRLRGGEPGGQQEKVSSYTLLVSCARAAPRVGTAHHHRCGNQEFHRNPRNMRLKTIVHSEPKLGGKQVVNSLFIGIATH